MAPAETGEYIAHHLRLAGRSDTLFSDDAVSRIHKAARGLPRAVNNLALQALIAAYANNAAIVDDKVKSPEPSGQRTHYGLLSRK